MRHALLITGVLLLIGCYPTHWRATPFCQYCLGDKSAPACQAACNTRRPLPAPTTKDALRDAKDAAFLEYAKCRVAPAATLKSCRPELQAWDVLEKAYDSRRHD